MTTVDMFGQCLLQIIMGKFLAFSLDCCFDHPENLAPSLAHIGQSQIFVESILTAKGMSAREISDCGYRNNCFACGPYHGEQSTGLETGAHQKYAGYGSRGRAAIETFPKAKCNRYKGSCWP